VSSRNRTNHPFSPTRNSVARLGKITSTAGMKVSDKIMVNAAPMAE
jgi:hypothetical protein